MTTTAIAKKSVLASGLLSFFLGPLGWFYAAPWKSAAIGGVAWALTIAILPQIFLFYLVLLVAPASAVAGVVYALGYNVIGTRTPLFGKSPEPAALPPRRS